MADTTARDGQAELASVTGLVTKTVYCDWSPISTLSNLADARNAVTTDKNFNLVQSIEINIKWSKLIFETQFIRSTQ